MVKPACSAAMAASLMCSGVSKSGSPAPKRHTSSPSAFIALALLSIERVSEGVKWAARSEISRAFWGGVAGCKTGGEAREGHRQRGVKGNEEKCGVGYHNQNEGVVAWTETGDRVVKRQSQSDPNVWVSLGDNRPAVATASSRDR